MVTMKSVRFRIEFSPVLGYTQSHVPQSSIDNDQGSEPPSMQKIPAPAATPLKRASVNTKQVAPYASTLVLIQEKGALSTFRHVFIRLRSEWKGKDVLRSPDAAASTTPMILTTPKMR